MTSSKPNYLPKAPTPNTITLEVRASKYELARGWGNEEDTVQSRAGCHTSKDGAKQTLKILVLQCPFNSYDQGHSYPL